MSGIGLGLGLFADVEPCLVIPLEAVFQVPGNAGNLLLLKPGDIRCNILFFFRVIELHDLDADRHVLGRTEVFLERDQRIRALGARALGKLDGEHVLHRVGEG